MSKQTAVRFYPPSYDVRVETVAQPVITHPDDAIVKVQYAGLCGSDLHAYRGHEIVDQVHTCGHEFVGRVVELGSNFSSQTTSEPEGHDRPDLYATLRVGDKVVSPFSVNCGECQLCRQGYTSRCLGSKLFGSARLEGAQAQYVRVPMAGGTLFDLSSAEVANTISDTSLLFLADILPTGLFAALQAINHPKVTSSILRVPWPTHLDDRIPPSNPVEESILTFAVIGLGPVGVCATVALADQLARKKLKFKIIGIDLNESRRTKTEAIFAKICETERYAPHGTFEARDIDDAKDIIKEWTSGVGCNAVLEIVGHNSALELAYEIVQPFGVISSVGVHAERPFPLTGKNLYDKNVSMDFGRCPARAMLPMAFELLARRQDVFGGVGGENDLVDRVVGFDQAVEMYKAFDRGDVSKILFDPWV